MAVLYGRARRLTAKNGGFRPGQYDGGEFEVRRGTALESHRPAASVAKCSAPSVAAFVYADLFTARAQNRRFWRLSALRAHTKVP